MVHSFDGFNHLIRLVKGERLAENLLKFALDTKCEGAWITGIGGATEVELGFYNLDAKEYKWQTFKGLCEITSLNGTITLGEDGKLMLHMHGTLADSEFKAFGGHIKDLVAGGTVEIFVHRAYKPIRRKPDPQTGLNLLDLS